MLFRSGREAIPVHIEHDGDGTRVRLLDGTEFEVKSDWRLGDSVFRGQVGGERMIVKTEFIRGGARLRYRGADMKVAVRTPRQAELQAMMPVKLPPDTSRLLLCPMPGLVVKLAVETGQEVQEGQALCTIEAMKMENILRAERKGVVARINAGEGDSLAVDDVIMEFE